MPRSSEAYLSDIIDARDTIELALTGVDTDGYLSNCITHARLIVGFRNRLAHDYATIDDEAVLRIAQHDVSVLRDECRALLAEVSEPGTTD